MKKRNRYLKSLGYAWEGRGNLHRLIGWLHDFPDGGNEIVSMVNVSAGKFSPLQDAIRNALAQEEQFDKSVHAFLEYMMKVPTNKAERREYDKVKKSFQEAWAKGKEANRFLNEHPQVNGRRGLGWCFLTCSS
jgi:hypothetical protein